MLCLYYQAHIEPKRTWFFVGVLRSFEHLCFDRTVDKQKNIFEFFVPAGNQEIFLHVMEHMVNTGIASEFTELPNRLTDPESIF